FYIVIVIVAFVIGIVETISIANYQRRDCYTTKEAIKVLTEYQKNNHKYIKASDVDSKVFN
ncbi:MAG: hypothetical protein D6756_11270, partial [Cyanobacteria bacterium J083]